MTPKLLGAPPPNVRPALLHLLGEGFIVDLFRQGEAIAPTEVEKRIFRMTM